MFKKLGIILLALLLSSCISFDKATKKNQKIALGERDIKYYANKTVSSLEIPPDLTKPNSKNAFGLDKYISDVNKNAVNFSGKNDAVNAPKSNIISVPSDIIVKKSGERRWLVVDRVPDVVWNLAKNFLKSNGFALKQANKDTGIMETDFLENHPEISDQSLGFIRSMLRRAIKTKYVLPVADKYRIRIEPVDDDKKSEVHLSLSSVEEVLTNVGGEEESTIWQSRPKDQALEVEMLYRLMTFLGSNSADAIEKITQAKDVQKVNVTQSQDVNGYTKLVFSLNKSDTWGNISWALDQLNVDVEDKDIKEGSFYINIARSKDRGILSRILGDNAIKKSFQILVKQLQPNITEVYFNDLSEKNEQKTIDFSHEFLSNIAKQF